MRKIIAFIAAALFVNTTVPAGAVDVSAGESNITYSDIAAIGNVNAVVWGKRQGSDESRIMVSTKRGASAWSKKTSIGGLDWSPWSNPQVAVTDSGRITVVWVDDENIVYREQTSTSWSAEQVLPESAIQSTWHEELEVIAEGEKITVIGYKSGATTNVVLASWTRENSNSEWTYQEIAPVVDSEIFGTCNKTDIVGCGYSLGEIKVSGNANGVLTVAWSLNRIKGSDYSLKGSTFAIQTARRFANQVSWTEKAVIATMKPTVSVQNFAFFIEDLTTNFSGATAIAWRIGFNSQAVKGYVAKSSANSNEFTKVDASAINSFGESNTLRLTTAGDTFWVAAESVTSSGDFFLRTGKLGNFSAARSTSLASKYQLREFVTHKSTPRLVLIGSTSNTNRSVFQAIVGNNAVVQNPTLIKNYGSKFSGVDRIELVSANNLVYLITGYKGQIFGVGLDAILI